MSKLSRVAIFAALVAGLGTVAASAAPRVQDLPDSFIFSPAGVLTRSTRERRTGRAGSRSGSA